MNGLSKMAQPEPSVLLILLIIVPCFSWNTDDLELFDLIEEINDNFYQLFGIDQSASSSDVRKSYRRLSLQYHPDKNNAENAEDKFRQIVAVYEVLKDEKKRERYNQILVEGLPDWRQSVYYYRRARKMGIYELGVVLSVIITVGQYLVAWAVYVEKRLALEEMLSSKKKKKEKKKKQIVLDDGVADDEELHLIPTPHILDLWPFRLSVFVFYSVYDLPTTLRHWKEEKRRKKEEEEEEAKALEKAGETEEIVRKPKKRVQPELPEYSSEMLAKFTSTTDSRQDTQGSDPEAREGSTHKKGGWSDEDLVMLSKAVNRFPGGCHQRWEKIAEMVGRPVSEVISKTKETKGNYSMQLSMSVQNSSFNPKPHSETFMISGDIITQSLLDADYDTLDVTSDDATKIRHRPTKVTKTAERTMFISQADGSLRTAFGTNKTKVTSVQKDNMAVSTDVPGGSRKEPWTQNQQTIFEWALKQHPKGTDKRWEHIAQQIPGKSKEDCMTRFKELAELVNNRKKMELQDVKVS